MNNPVAFPEFASNLGLPQIQPPILQNISSSGPSSGKPPKKKKEERMFSWSK
jgi:hypothetical protein